MVQLGALYHAAIAGDARAIAELEGKANRVDEHKYSILHTESSNGKTERVRFILREFANKNLLTKLTKSKHTALHLATYNGHTEVAEILIDEARHLPETSFQAFLRLAGGDSETALHIAVQDGNVDIVKLLVEADPTDVHFQNRDGKTPMYIAVEQGYNDIVEIISTTCVAPSLDGPDGSTALRINNLDQVMSPGGTLFKIMDKDAYYAAAIAGDAYAIAKLEMEADSVNEDEETILHIESRSGNTERVRFILREFSNKNLLVKLNKYKQTALHSASQDWPPSTTNKYRGRTEVAEILIDAARHLPSSSANDDTHDNSAISSFEAFLRQGDGDLNTALHVAVKEGILDIVKLLVEADPRDPHIPNRQGKSPIYIAAEKGYTDIVKFLGTTCTGLSNLKGPGGSNALHAAIKNGNIEVVEVLIGAARLLSSSSDDDNISRRVSPFQAFLRKGDEDMNTALHIAVMQGNLATAKLLVEADPSDQHIRNDKGEAPFYIAVERGYADMGKMICSTSTAFFNLSGPGVSTTAFHAVIKNLDEAKKEVTDVFKMIIDLLRRAIISEKKTSDEYSIHKTFLECVYRKTDEYRQTVLELAVERNYMEVVELILDVHNPAYRDDWIDDDDFISLMPLIYKAMEKEYKDIVKLLTQRYEAGAELSVDLKNQASLVSAIRRRKTDIRIMLFI